MEYTGAEIVVKCLQKEHIEHVFGYPGGAVLFIYDEIFKQKDFQHILVRHEQAAVHAADAYSRSSEKVGVCLVTSGPGVTNAVTGIATAYMDSVPMVIITGQVPTHAIGLDAFQECDTVGITRPCVKHNFLVKNVNDLALTMKKAFHIAKTVRPGPVLVDIPKDITKQKCKFEYPKEITMRSYSPTLKGHSGQIKKAARAILEAKRLLADSIDSEISSRMEDFLKSTGTGSNESVKQASEIVTKNTTIEAKLTGYKQVKTEAISMNGKFQFYVLLEYPVGQANQALLNQIKKDEVLSTQKDADKAMAELEAEIEKRRKSKN